MSSTGGTFQDKLVVAGVFAIMVAITLITQKCDGAEAQAKASEGAAVMSKPHTQTAPVLINPAAPEPTYEERIAAELGEMSKDITNTNISVFSTSDDIMLYINKLNAAGRQASQASSSPNESLAKAAADLQEVIKARQLEDYPVLREKWVDILLREAVGAQNISVSVGGKRNTVLNFTAGHSSASMDGETVHFIYEDVYRKLRFKQANYKWDRYYAYKVRSLNDTDLMK